MATTDIDPVPPDTKDWTWVLRRPCPDCGYDSAAPQRSELGRMIRDNAAGWARALGRSDAVARPTPTTWSVVEYACHVRDVHRLFAQRIDSMLTEDGPRFPDWDQDRAALESRYHAQAPAAVAEELVAAADAVARRYDAVPDEAWGRTGLRSDGSAFTIETLGRYHLHDLVHHAWDVDLPRSR